MPKYPKFNDLPFEERKRINYYINQFRVLTLEQVLSMLDNSIGQYQKQKIKRWIKGIKEFMNEYENEYEEREDI